MSLRKKEFLLPQTLALAFLFLAATLSGLWAKPLPEGSLTGYVYQNDGTTPAQGAVVVLKNMSSGATHRSEPASALGFFKLESLERGLYMFGAVTEQGEFNGRDIIGIEGDTAARLSIALEVQAETQAKTRDPKTPPAIRGEKFVGRVTNFDESKMEAEIFVEQGEMLLGDSVHLFGDKERGSETDFYQEVRKILQNGVEIDKAVAGQYYVLLLENPALELDWLYVKEKAGLGVIFLTPCGIANILAATTTIVYTYIKEPPETSVYRHR
ncbi:MAG: hypothetical protein JW747_10010 [Candidatus Aminicenantes bacterium]|nr:hypothetical protein [Candidatus Aminicenantes bacterium]